MMNSMISFVQGRDRPDSPLHTQCTEPTGPCACVLAVKKLGLRQARNSMRIWFKDSAQKVRSERLCIPEVANGGFQMLLQSELSLLEASVELNTILMSHVVGRPLVATGRTRAGHVAPKDSHIRSQRSLARCEQLRFPLENVSKLARVISSEPFVGRCKQGNV